MACRLFCTKGSCTLPAGDQSLMFLYYMHLPRIVKGLMD